ncbi:hypothetical protein BMB171_C2984 [Bacillus thuringiensis BMB171]|nr:hypothetical protein BMB171_C2984 [Bacillus thuringiensis BMB171]
MFHILYFPLLPDQLLFHKFLLLNNHFLTLFEFAEMFRCTFSIEVNT